MATMAEQINKSINARHRIVLYGRGCWGVEGLLDAAVRWHEKHGSWPRPRDWQETEGLWPTNSAVYYHYPATQEKGWSGFIAEAQEVAEKRRAIPVP